MASLVLRSSPGDVHEEKLVGGVESLSVRLAPWRYSQLEGGKFQNRLEPRRAREFQGRLDTSLMSPREIGKLMTCQSATSPTASLLSPGTSNPNSHATAKRGFPPPTPPPPPPKKKELPSGNVQFVQKNGNLKIVARNMQHNIQLGHTNQILVYLIPTP